MKVETILIIIGILSIFVLAFFVWKWWKKREWRSDDLTTEIENLTAASPPAVGKTEKGKIIGEIEIVVRGKAVTTAPLAEKEATIGRDPTCSTIVISEPTVSKLHCTLVPRSDKVYIKDNHSTNGTYIENKRILQEELNDNDIVSLGKKGIVKIIYHKRKET